MPRYHNESVDWRPRTRTVRTPSSAPLARTSGVTRCAGSPVERVHPNHGASCVVAVKSHPGIHVELGSRPGSEDRAELGTDQTIGSIA